MSLSDNEYRTFVSETTEKEPFVKKNCLFRAPGKSLFFIVFALSFVFALNLFKVNKNWFFQRQNTALVIDVGSAHTLFSMFTWTDPLKITMASICDIRRGISSLKIEEIDGFMSTCLAKLASEPEFQLRDTKVFVGATAGMRILSPARSRQYMDKIRSVLKRSEYYLQRDEDVEIISGKREGFYDWLTINYFNDKKKGSAAIDMGGSSCQLSYECAETNNHEEDEYCIKNSSPLIINGEKYNIFSKSETCYGIISAHKRYLISLIHSAYQTSSSFTEAIIDPCAISRQTFKKSELTELCTNTTRDPNFYKLFEGLSDNHTFVFLPSRNKSCSMESLFEKCESLFGICFSTYRDLPSYINNYVGESSLYWDFFKFLKQSTGYEDIKKRIKQICSLKRSVDHGSHPVCFNLAYSYRVLLEKYHFLNNTRALNSIHYAYKYRGFLANWSLGFLLAKDDRFNHIYRET